MAVGSAAALSALHGNECHAVAVTSLETACTAVQTGISLTMSHFKGLTPDMSVRRLLVQLTTSWCWATHMSQQGATHKLKPKLLTAWQILDISMVKVTALNSKRLAQLMTDVSEPTCFSVQKKTARSCA